MPRVLDTLMKELLEARKLGKEGCRDDANEKLDKVHETLNKFSGVVRVENKFKSVERLYLKIHNEVNERYW